MFNNLLDALLGPLLNMPDPYGLLAISFMITGLITLAYKFMTDQELMKSLKEELKEIQKELKKLKDNPEKMMEVQKKAMEKNMKYMMHSMKPTLITFIPIIIIFGWLRNYYMQLGNPVILDLGFVGLTWIWTYILFSIIISISLRKVLKIH